MVKLNDFSFCFPWVALPLSLQVMAFILQLFTLCVVVISTDHIAFKFIIPSTRLVKFAAPFAKFIQFTAFKYFAKLITFTVYSTKLILFILSTKLILFIFAPDCMFYLQLYALRSPSALSTVAIHAFSYVTFP